ncbi:MAG: CooT family nickel-binding protein [Chloroflexi bacterium]|nr:CooT family nickel-binding protein [Chloroflexota bacterium]
MCLAKVYESTDDDTAVLEDVVHMEIEGDRIEVETLFGESRAFRGKVRLIDFLKSRVELEVQLTT